MSLTRMGIPYELPYASMPVATAAHGGGGQLGNLAPDPSLKGAPCLKDRYTLIEQSDLDTLYIINSC